MSEGQAIPVIKRTWPGVWQMPLEVRKLFWQGTGGFPGCGFVPNEYQSTILCSPERVKLITGGERSGKSYITAAEAYIWLWQMGAGDVMWIVGPDYEQARPEFTYLRQMMEKSGLLHPTQRVSTPRIGPWSMHSRPGALIVTKSSSDPQTLAGIPPAGVLMVECAQQAHEAYLRLRGRIAEKRAPMFMSGTFEGSLGWVPKIWREWRAANEDEARSFSLPSWTNLAVYPGGRLDREIVLMERTFPPDFFMERLGGEPCPPSRLVFREFSVDRHVTMEAEFDPSKKVQLWIDPGYAHYYAIMAAQVLHDPERVVIFDEIAEKGMLAHELIARVKAKPWWPNVAVLVMDKASKQHLGHESQAETWVAATGKRAVMGYVPIQDGILRHKTFLMDDPMTGKPKMIINPRCKHLIWEYGNYMYAKDAESRPTSEVPVALHDDCCVVGETLIDMPGGKRPIKELVGTTPLVYCYLNGGVAIRQANKVWLSRENAEIVRILMDKGELHLTADHPVMRIDGEYVRADSLRPGDQLMVLNRAVTSDGYTRIAMSREGRKCGQLEHRFIWEQLYGPIPQGYHVHHKDGQRWNHHPDNLEALPPERHNTKHHKGKQLNQEARKRLGHISKASWDNDYATRLEIARRNVRAAHLANTGRVQADETRALIAESSRRRWRDPEYRAKVLAKRDGFHHSEKSIEKMRRAKKEYWASEKGREYAKQRDSLRNEDGTFGNHRVIAVLPAGVADVYNMEVEEAQNYVANDVVIHNCKATTYGLVANFGLVMRRKRRQVEVQY